MKSPNVGSGGADAVNFSENSDKHKRTTINNKKQ